MNIIINDLQSTQQTSTLSVENTLLHAIDQHRAGHLQQAEQLYKSILQIQPYHADANHNLGALAVQVQRPDLSLALFATALKSNPDQPQFWISYIDALIQTDQIESAHLTLAEGIQQGLQGTAVDALTARLQDVTQFSPLSNPARPGFEDMQALTLLLSEGRYREAQPIAHAMTTNFPLHGFGWKALGLSLAEEGHNEAALIALQKASALSPSDAEAHYSLATLLQKTGELNEAATSYTLSLEINPGFVEAHSNLGTTLHELGRYKEAEAHYRQALELNPKCIGSLLGLGTLYEETNRIVEARFMYIQSLKVMPEKMKLRYSLALSSKTKAQDTNFLEMIAIAQAAQNNDARLSIENMIYLHFALGKCYDDRENYEHAFIHFLEGCKLKRSTINYNRNEASQEISTILDIFDSDTINRLRGAGAASCMPIFILGMPRSGTTLTEQIITSHPDVSGAGEQPYLMQIAQKGMSDQATHSSLISNLRSLNHANLTAWGEKYLSNLKQHAPGSMRITDKMPGNFLLLGLIHLILPNAKIIHIKRNPIDTCLSNFTQLFSSGHEYTYDQEELGYFYADYLRVMRHWSNVLPANAFLDVNYEDIIADQESQARRILDFCGLEWNSACLDFHHNSSRVRTASMMQVRRPMYKSSVERWRHYEKFLMPLLEALDSSPLA